MALYVIASGMAIAGGFIAYCRFKERTLRHIQTGEQRRKLYPADTCIGAGAADVLAQKDFVVKRLYHTLKSGEQIFYQTVQLQGKEPTHVVVFLHGYTSHSDLQLEAMSEVAREGYLAVIPDLPGHGRSDGLLCFIPDWWQWVDKVWEFFDDIVTPLRTQGGKSRKLFLTGLSLGAGLSVCLAVMRPTFFDGLVPIAPLLCVSDDVKPPLIVQILFRKLLGPLKLTWPVTPSKDLDQYDFRVPEQGKVFCNVNPLSMMGLKPRLASACEMGFTFPEWMEQNLKNIRTPFLVLHGKADKITDPTVSDLLHEQASVKDKAIKLYDGAYHCELWCCWPGHEKTLGLSFLSEQKAQTKQSVKDLTDWIGKRC